MFRIVEGLCTFSRAVKLCEISRLVQMSSLKAENFVFRTKRPTVIRVVKFTPWELILFRICLHICVYIYIYMYAYVVAVLRLIFPI